MFWSSDKLTGSQTLVNVWFSRDGFWSSDKLTGSQTELAISRCQPLFWSSDKLTGSQTGGLAVQQHLRVLEQ